MEEELHRAHPEMPADYNNVLVCRSPDTAIIKYVCWMNGNMRGFNRCLMIDPTSAFPNA
jgi:hypothetical protein